MRSWLVPPKRRTERRTVYAARKEINLRRPLALKDWLGATPFESVGAALSVKEAVCMSISVSGLFRIFILGSLRSIVVWMQAETSWRACIHLGAKLRTPGMSLLSRPCLSLVKV